jgi:hypothetical protein
MSWNQDRTDSFIKYVLKSFLSVCQRAILSLYPNPESGRF